VVVYNFSAIVDMCSGISRTHKLLLNMCTFYHLLLRELVVCTLLCVAPEDYCYCVAMDEDSRVKKFTENVQFGSRHSCTVPDFHQTVQVKVSIVTYICLHVS